MLDAWLSVAVEAEGGVRGRGGVEGASHSELLASHSWRGTVVPGRTRRPPVRVMAGCAWVMARCAFAQAIARPTAYGMQAEAHSRGPLASVCAMRA